jgi:GTP-binding protein Era
LNKEETFRSGFVGIAGRPNVGKSTLLNSLVGEKLAIISNKPQTTRNRIQGVLTKPRYQAIFLDTPGIHRPRHKLGELMVKAARSAVADADITLFLVSAADSLTDEDKYVLDGLKRLKNLFLVINKIDAAAKPVILEIIAQANEIVTFAQNIPVSALKSDNLEALLTEIERSLPEGPKFFPDDYITDQPERFIAAEIIREKALNNLRDEVPHGAAAEIIMMKKRDGLELFDIEATIYCEKDSHKGIVIGKNGAMLKLIGAEARRDIERFLGAPVNLQLWVKVKKDWRDNQAMAKSLMENIL